MKHLKMIIVVLGAIAILAIVSVVAYLATKEEVETAPEEPVALEDNYTYVTENWYTSDMPVDKECAQRELTSTEYSTLSNSVASFGFKIDKPEFVTLYATEGAIVYYLKNSTVYFAVYNNGDTYECYPVDDLYATLYNTDVLGQDLYLRCVSWVQEQNLDYKPIHIQELNGTEIIAHDDITGQKYVVELMDYEPFVGDDE